MSYTPNAGLFTGSLVATGQESVPRQIANTVASVSNGNIRVAVFRARKSETVTQVRFVVTTGVAVTDAYIGLYTVAADGAMTRVAITGDIGSSFSAAGLKTVSFTSGYAVVAGSLIAVGIGVNYPSSPPAIAVANGVAQGESVGLPPNAALLAMSGSPLKPASSYSAVTVAALAAVTAPYCVLLP